MLLNRSSKWQPFCPGRKELICCIISRWTYNNDTPYFPEIAGMSETKIDIFGVIRRVSAGMISQQTWTSVVWRMGWLQFASNHLLKICCMEFMTAMPTESPVISNKVLQEGQQADHWRVPCPCGPNGQITMILSMYRPRQFQLEQLERLRSEDTPRRLMITHTIGSQVKKIIDLELKTLQSRHDFQSQGQMTLKI